MYHFRHTQNGKCGSITTTKRSWGFDGISSILDDYRNGKKRGQPIGWKGRFTLHCIQIPNNSMDLATYS